LYLTTFRDPETPESVKYNAQLVSQDGQKVAGKGVSRN